MDAFHYVFQLCKYHRVLYKLDPMHVYVEINLAEIRWGLFPSQCMVYSLALLERRLLVYPIHFFYYQETFRIAVHWRPVF